MSIIKKEPNTNEGIPTTPYLTTVHKDDTKPTSNADSRQPLKQKPSNMKQTQKKGDPLEVNKQEIMSKFLLSPGKVTTSKSISKQAEEQTIVKKEHALLFQQVSNTPSKTKHSIPMESCSTKKLKVDNKFTKFSSSPENSSIKTDLQLTPATDKHKNIRARDSSSPPRNPGKYLRINNLLYQTTEETESASYYDDIFEEVQDGKEKKMCIEFASMNLAEWLQTGEMLMREHKNIMERLILARIKLSHRFKAITDLINERATALNAQGEILDDKMKKIQDLGKEILEII